MQRLVLALLRIPLLHKFAGTKVKRTLVPRTVQPSRANQTDREQPRESSTSGTDHETDLAMSIRLPSLTASAVTSSLSETSAAVQQKQERGNPDSKEGQPQLYEQATMFANLFRLNKVGGEVGGIVLQEIVELVRVHDVYVLAPLVQSVATPWYHYFHHWFGG